MKRRMKPLLALLLISMIFFTGCVTQQPAPTPTPEPTTNLALYYVKITENDAYLVREVHEVEVEQTTNLPQMALKELIDSKPTTPGAQRVLPSDTQVLDIKIENGLATVNFSPEVLKANVGAAGEFLGITSIVNTLTEFPDIKKVSFLVDGQWEKAKDWWGHVGLYEQPFTRNLALVHEPAIWVTTPTAHQVISSPLEVRGSARVLENQVSLRLKNDDGHILAEDSTTTSQETPGRGDFIAKLEFESTTPGQGQLEVFNINPQDGSEQNKVTIPVEWQ